MKKVTFGNLASLLTENGMILNEQNKDVEPMKITEKTKIKDLLPEGYEIDAEFNCSKFVDGKNTGIIEIPFKKKEVKDFKWYVKEYYKRFKDEKPYEFTNIDLAIESFSKGIPMFEFKIGLLKFICDDLKIDIEILIRNYVEMNGWSGCILVICPKEFLESIFK